MASCIRFGITLLLYTFFINPVVAQSHQSAEPNPPARTGAMRPVKATAFETSWTLSPVAAPSQEWTFHKTADGKHPNGTEQQYIWLMNRARANPTFEGIWLAMLRKSDVQSAMSYFSVQKETLMSEFAAIAPRPPAAFDNRLYAAALDHTNYMIAFDTQSHVGQFTRLAQCGFSYTNARGSVYSYSKSGLYGHAGFNIDWGGSDGTGMQTGRGHRQGIMGSYSNVGVAVVLESDSRTSVGPEVTTINYADAKAGLANHYNRFIVGTVWEDLNGNAMYDPGEGLNGVTVMPDHGTFYAVTSEGGGYAIPVDAGTYTVTYSGGELGAPETRTVTVGSTSVLVTWIDRADLVGPGARVERTASGYSVTLDDQKVGIPYCVETSPDLKSWEWSGSMPSGYGSTLSFSVQHNPATDGLLFVRVFEGAY